MPAVPEPATPFDLANVVAQFTALRHDVNLQTKAARAATEQTAKVLELVDASAADDAVKPAMKALVEIADALVLSLKNMEKLRESISKDIQGLPTDTVDDFIVIPAPQRSPNRLARLFGAGDLTALHTQVNKMQNDFIAQNMALTNVHGSMMNALNSSVDGYAMSLRRVERTLAEFDVEQIDCLGEPFDAETMEVMDIGGDGAPNHVTEVLRRGYTWKGRLLRCAQVRVAGGN